MNVFPSKLSSISIFNTFSPFQRMGFEEFLTPEDKSMLTSTAQQPFCLYKIDAQKAKEKKLAELLSYVAAGAQDEAEALIKQRNYRALLLVKGDVVDCARRKFINITAFQYALWAKDSHMWRMLAKYLPEDIQASQLNELVNKNRGISFEFNNVLYEHQHSFDLSSYIAFLRKYNRLAQEPYRNFTLRSHEEYKSHFTTIKKIWCEEGGSMQRILPMHIIHEYFYPDRSFEDHPNLFLEPKLERSLIFYNEIEKKCQSWHDALIPSSQLGSHYAIYRGMCTGIDARGGNHPEGNMVDDLIAMIKLDKIRTGEIKKLKRQLDSSLNHCMCVIS